MSKKLSTLIPNTILSPFNRVLYDNILQPYVEEKQEHIQTRSVSINREDYADITSEHIDANISQYQPIITFDNVKYSFYDLVSLMQRYGINVEDFDQWGSCEANSMNLPINYDKFVNYNKYGWIGDGAPNYVVIRNTSVQTNEAIIQSARLTNNDGLILAAMNTLISDLYSTDPLGGFDVDGFDAYNLDGAVVSVSSISDWEANNKWVHVDDILPGTSYQLGTFPIIEYSNKVKLVEWIKLIHGWSYRASINSNWEKVTVVPTLQELQAGQREIVTVSYYINIIPSTKRIYFSTTSGFVIGDKLVIDGSTNRWTIDGVFTNYVTIAEDNFSYFRFNDSKKAIKLSDYDVVDVTSTEVVVKGDVTSFIGAIDANSKITVIDFFTNVPYQFKLISASFSSGVTHLAFDLTVGANIPTTELNGRFTNIGVSSIGDTWSGLSGHWCYNGIVDAVVCTNKSSMPKTVVSTTYAPDSVISIIPLGSHQPNSTQQITLKINGIEHTHFTFGVYGSQFIEANTDYQLINAIKLDSDMITSIATTVTVEIGNDAVEDSGYNKFILRTSENELALKPVCLNFYKHYIQHQTNTSIYPLFEAYTTSNTPTLLPKGINILKFKEDGENLVFSQEVKQYISMSNDNIALLVTDMVNDNSEHFQVSTIYGYKHIWSNNNNRSININQVDQNGHPSTTSNIWKCPDYLLGNVNNIVTNTFDIMSLTRHFQTVSNANPLYRTISENVIQTNQSNSIVTYSTRFAGIVNQLVNKSLFANILDAHKQIRLLYMSIFFKEIINTITADTINNLSIWFDSILNQIRTYDQLKTINRNELLHPLTAAMLFSDKKTVPFIVDNNILTHDNQLISYSDVINFVEQAIVNSLFYGLTPQTVDKFIYMTIDTIFIYQASTTSWVQHKISDIVLNLWKTLEDSLYALCDTTIDSVGVVNPTSVKKSLKQKYIQYSNMKGFVFPYSNRAFYKLSDSFTWMYDSVLLTNVTSPLLIVPTLTNEYWGASWKEIYNNIYGTPTPHLEPWKIQGYLTKPIWWDSHYKDMSNTRLWLSVMWTNILNGIIPLGLSLPGAGVGTGVAGQVSEFVFVPVNIYSASTSDGFAPDDILPPFRSLPSSPTATDLLVQSCVLINDLVYIDLAKTNTVLDDFGNGTLQEWEWKQQIDYRYDEIYSLYNSDPTIMFKTSGSINVDGVEFIASKLINNESFHNDEVSQLLNMYKTYSTYYNNDFSKFDWINIDHTMGVFLGSYINKDNIVIEDIPQNNYNHVQKTDEYNTLQNVTNFKVTIQDIDNTKRNDLMSGYVFLVDTFNREVHDVEILTLMYSDLNVTSSTTATIDPNVYNCLTTGIRITVTWDFYSPSQFDEQTEFYVIKRGSDTISLCRSVKELNSTNYIDLPLDYPYGLHIGVVLDEFNVLNKQITNQTFKSYAVSYGSTESISLPTILTGVQQLINFFDGYIKLLRKNGITEYDQLFPITDDNFNRPLDYQFAKEMLLASLYNDKNNRDTFVGNLYTMLPFNNNIYVDSTKQVLSLVQSFERQDLTLLHDRDGASIPTSNLIVFRHSPISIQTNILIGGGVIYLSTSQDMIALSDTVCDMTIRKYPSSLNIISGNLPNLNGFIDLGNTLEYSFAESVNNLSNAYSHKPNSEIFTDNAYQQIGFVNNDWYSNIGMSRASSFQFWKEMQQSKGSIECIDSFSNISNQEITVDEIFAVNRHSIGFDNVFDYVDVDFRNKKAVLENSDSTCASLTLPIINSAKSFSNAIINQDIFIPNAQYNCVGEYDSHELVVVFDLNQPFYHEIFPRFSGTIFFKIFYQSYSENGIIVIVNGVSVDYNVTNVVGGYMVYININSDIINDISVITKSEVTLTEYHYNSMDTIKFNESSLHVVGTATYYYVGKTRLPVKVGWSPNIKTNIDDLEFFDPVKNIIPNVDYIKQSDPFVAYNVEYGEFNFNANTNNINKVGEIWYKKSLIYSPFYCNKLSSNERIDQYGKTQLQDDGYYQFVRSINLPQSWYDFVQTDSTVEINGEPLSYIMKRSRLSINDPWSNWTIQNVLHERHIANYVPTVSISPTIGVVGDIVYVYVDGRLSNIVVNDGTPITINITNTFDQYTIDFIIRPVILSDTPIVEYKREFNYYTNIVNGDRYYYFWVKNYRDTNFYNAYNLNERHYITLNGLYGLLDSNICVFNMNYVFRLGKIAVTDNKTPHTIWSFHNTHSDAQKIPKDVWVKLVNCFDPLMINTNSFGLDSVVCSKDELIYIINNVIVDNYDKISPYIPSDLIINNGSTLDDLVELYFILQPGLVNSITKTILLSRKYDVSSLIMQTSQIELTSNQEIM